MKLGIMGGTLDPVHNGHIAIAEALREKLSLDRMILLPSGNPPHKRFGTDKELRLNMCLIAATEHPILEVSDLEVRREGTTYTVDTLNDLHRRSPEDELFYIIGSDTLAILDTWRDFPKVAQLCTFICAKRPGEEDDTQTATRLEKQYDAKIVLTDVLGPEISSTQVRMRTANGEDISDIVPVGVAEFIRKNGLYITNRTREGILEELEKRLKKGRYIHTIGVAETAKHMAERFGEDPVRTEIAGLLHDCAKYMTYGDMLRLIREEITDYDDLELEQEPILHAPAGMVVAKREFGICDKRILNAIRTHTLGDAAMDTMGKIIYVADFIEPNRKDFPGLTDARRLAEIDLDAAVLKCAELSSAFVTSKGGKVHPRTMEMIKTLSGGII